MMCRNRIAVEWGFAKVKNLFKMLTFKVSRSADSAILNLFM